MIKPPAVSSTQRRRVMSRDCGDTPILKEYSKPVIEKIDLTAEEMLVDYCKTGNTGGKFPKHCTPWHGGGGHCFFRSPTRS